MSYYTLSKIFLYSGYLVIGFLSFTIFNKNLRNKIRNKLKNLYFLYYLTFLLFLFSAQIYLITSLKSNYWKILIFLKKNFLKYIK